MRLGQLFDVKHTLTLEEALAALPEGDVHCFLEPVPGLMVGGTHDHRSVVKALTNASKIQIAGPEAQARKHGIAIPGKEFRYTWYETTRRTDEA